MMNKRNKKGQMGLQDL